MVYVGAALGGFVTEWVGIKAVFAIDSPTYVVSAVFLKRTIIPQSTEKSGRGPVVKTAVREIVDGWSHLRTHPRIGRIAFAKATWAIAGGALVFMLALLGEAVSPDAHSVGIGVLFAARGFGTGVGPILARNIFRNRSHWPGVLGACIVFSGLSYTVVGFVPWTYWIIVFVVLSHAASGANWVLTTVMLQKRTEDRYRGRVFATEWLFLMLADVLSIVSASLLLEASILGLRTSFFVFGTAQVLCGLLWIFYVVPLERKA